MTHTVPPRFLFRFAFPLRKIDEAPASTDAPPALTDAYRLPSLSGMDGAAEFAEWRCGWHVRGLAVNVLVRGKREAVSCDALSPARSDGVQVWLDTRCTQTVHRATRFCHHFALLPAGAGKQKRQPSVTPLAIANARDESGTPPTIAVRIASELHDDGYDLRAWFPAEALTGYDPSAQPRLGFYGIVCDRELGEQCLTVGREFPFESDPSLWQTLQLTP